MKQSIQRAASEAKRNLRTVNESQTDKHNDDVSSRQAVLFNAWVWGVGNGLISTSLVIFLIRDICSGHQNIAVGSAIAWIIAAPRIAGLLRLATPGLIDWFGSRKWFTIFGFLFSPIVLLAIPLGIPEMMRHHGAASSVRGILLLLVLVWCVYHLIEYFGTISLWSIIGDLVPQKHRAEFVGRREALMIFGQTLGFLTSGVYSFFVIENMPAAAPKWIGYLPPTYSGITCLLLAVVPLLRLAEVPWKRESTKFFTSLQQLAQPFHSRRFCIFIFFGMYLQFAGGLTQSVQNMYQIYVLHISLLVSLCAQTLTRTGQFAIASFNGKTMDRFGFFPIMCVSILTVSTGSLFYFFADASRWYLVFGAAFVWIFWVGVNVGISTLVLNYSPQEYKASGISVFYTASTLSFALSTLLGGYLADRFQDWVFAVPFCTEPLDYAKFSFLCSFILRVSSLFPLAWAVYYSRE